MSCDANTVVSNPSLREVIGADPLRSVPTANLLNMCKKYSIIIPKRKQKKYLLKKKNSMSVNSTCFNRSLDLLDWLLSRSISYSFAHNIFSALALFWTNTKKKANELGKRLFERKQNHQSKQRLTGNHARLHNEKSAMMPRNPHT